MTLKPLNGQHVVQASCRPDSRSIFEKYEAAAEVFTLQQWECVVLRFDCCLSQQSIADYLDVSRGAVSNRLTRAKARLQEHQRRLRAEAFHEQRQALIEDEKSVEF